MSKAQKLSEREKSLIVKYAYLIERYLRSRHEPPQEKNKQYKNPRNIRRYKNFYVVRLTVDSVLETVPMIPTLEEAVAVRDELISARKFGYEEFYAALNGFREKYGGKK